MADAAVEIKGLSFAYQRQPVLSGVDLAIPRGDFVALLGPNGGGKSTLLKLIAGILKPARGEIRVLGRPVGEGGAGLGYVPQDVAARPPFPVTVLDVVLLGRLGPGHHRFSAEDRAIALACLGRVGLGAQRDRLVGQLSGGQRQRAFIARALAGRPELLLLDEPTASVDQAGQAELFELLAELNRAATILMVSHDLTVISSHVKSVACVNRTVHYHPSPEITPEMLRKTYACPVELVAHGLPHRVLAVHRHDGDEGA